MDPKEKEMVPSMVILEGSDAAGWKLTTEDRFLKAADAWDYVRKNGEPEVTYWVSSDRGRKTVGVKVIERRTLV